MLCSAKELGLAADAEGILQLPLDAPLGADFTFYMGLPDTLFELEITPNRSDLLSHIGLARELGALLGRPILLPQVNLKETGSATTSKGEGHGSVTRTLLRLSRPADRKHQGRPLAPMADPGLGKDRR